MNQRKTEFVFTLLAASNRIEGRLNRVLSNVRGISFTEYFLLKQLKNFHNSAAMRVELARAVNLTPSAVTRALRPLEKMGYVSTLKGQRDARQSIASLTPAGVELVSDADSLVNDEIAEFSLPGTFKTEVTQVLDGLAPIQN